MITGSHGDVFSPNAHLPKQSEEDDYYIPLPESFSAESNSTETDSSHKEVQM